MRREIVLGLFRLSSLIEHKLNLAGNTHGTEGMIASQGPQYLRTLLWCPVLGNRVKNIQSR